MNACINIIQDIIFTCSAVTKAKLWALLKSKCHLNMSSEFFKDRSKDSVVERQQEVHLYVDQPASHRCLYSGHSTLKLKMKTLTLKSCQYTNKNDSPTFYSSGNFNFLWLLVLHIWGKKWINHYWPWSWKCFFFFWFLIALASIFSRQIDFYLHLIIL